MSPEAEKKEWVLPEEAVETKKVPVKAKKEKLPEGQRYFAEIEVVPEHRTSPLTVFYKGKPINNKHSHPMYDFHWCNKDQVAMGRKEIWHIVDRHHSDFEDISIPVDHSPKESFYAYKDLILGCARKETTEQKRQRLAEKVRRRDEMNKRHDETMIKVSKESMRESIRALENATNFIDQEAKT